MKRLKVLLSRLPVKAIIVVATIWLGIVSAAAAMTVYGVYQQMTTQAAMHYGYEQIVVDGVAVWVRLKEESEVE